MSNPTSSSPRGRGRGRIKELSASERVAKWVNQREAKRLSKEKWARRSADTQSPTPDSEEGTDMQARVEEMPESESSLDRSKAKRHEVKLYVPPSLRNRKGENPSSVPPPDLKDSMPVNQSDREVFSEPQNNEISDGTVFSTKPRSRGRGRKKPEVEIYVPRALRSSKQDVKTPSKTQQEELKSGNDKSQVEENYSDAHEHEMLSQSQVEQHDMYDDNVKFNSESVSTVPYNEIESVSYNQDLRTKKMRHGQTDEHQLYPNIENTEAVNTQTPTETSTDAYTFEFYDPAIVAFMPSPQIINKPCDPNSYLPSGSNAQASYLHHGLAPENVSVSSENVGNFQEKIQENNQLNMPLSPVDHENCASETSQSKCNMNCETKTQQTEDKKCGIYSQSGLPECVLSQEGELSNTLMSDDKSSSEIGFHEQSEICQTNISSKNSVELDLENGNCSSGVSCSKESSSQGHSGINISEHFKSLQPVEVLSAKQNVEENEKTGTNVSQCEEQRNVVEDEIDEDSWDNLFDDNGDCLDESVMKELTEYVGKVEIDKPKINYLNYEPKEPELDLEAFSHIVEIYDFSRELATCDLITAFKDFSSRGFDVKWVDDTHALGIFSSAVAAKEALRMMHPLLKVRPMSEASKKGQSKARHCQEFLQPYKARPQTTSMAARRLVAGALGMAPRVSREVREQERKKLREAKEKRRQERQQKNDIWDGTIGKCAMDDEDARS